MSEKPEGYVFGRPTKYHPDMCDQAIEFGRLGKSKAWIAATFGVCKRTVQTWEAEYPDFLAAMALAKTLEQQWWEDKGQDNLDAQSFQSSMWNRSMAARFPDDWREKVGHVGGDKNDEPIKQEVTFGADAFTRSIAGLATRSGEDSKDGGADA